MRRKTELVYLISNLFWGAFWSKVEGDASIASNKVKAVFVLVVHRVDS